MVVELLLIENIKKLEDISDSCYNEDVDPIFISER